MRWIIPDYHGMELYLFWILQAMTVAETMISQSEILASPGEVSEGILLPGSMDG